MLHTNAASSLSDVLRCITDIFSGIGDATPILVCKREKLLTSGVGSAPSVTFVPDPKGTLGDPPMGTGGTGYEGGITHGCAVYVRGSEGGGDLGRFDDAYRLADIVVGALSRAARGRWGGGDFADDSPSDADAFGADISFRFTYTRGVQRNAKIWKLPANPVAPSPPQVDKPDGTPSSTIGPLDVAVIPQP